MPWVAGYFVCATFLSFLLLSPAAAAAEASGDILASGGLSFPAGTTAEGRGGLTAYLGNAGPKLGVTHFEARAPHAIVRTFVEEYVSHDNVWVTTDTYDSTQYVTNLSIVSLADRGFGYLALDSDEALTWDWQASTDAAVSTRVESTIAYGTSTSRNTAPEMDYYYQKVEGSHLYLKGAGALGFAGPATLKLRGMTLQMASDEGVATIVTGEERGAALKAYRRWVFVQADDLTLEANATGPWIIAARQAGLSWDGNLALHALSGTLSTPNGILSLRPGPATIRGEFDSQMLPVQLDGTAATQMVLQGHLDGGSNILSATPPTRTTANTGLVAILVAGVAVVSAGVSVLRARTLRAPTPPPPVPLAIPPPPPSPEPAPADLTPELCVSLAETQVQMECWPRALHWITLARQMCPTSATVRATEAFVLGEMGQTEEALAAYEEASRLDPEEGEHDLNAARLALRRGQPVDVVEAFVLRALARSPRLVQEVEPDDALMEALSGRPAFEAALVEAWSYF